VAVASSLTVVISFVLCIDMRQLVFSTSLLHCSADHRHLHAFPTRRSSDLTGTRWGRISCRSPSRMRPGRWPTGTAGQRPGRILEDRKSTRLNSSHGSISYAVFCLKKKKKQKKRTHMKQVTEDTITTP